MKVYKIFHFCQISSLLDPDPRGPNLRIYSVSGSINCFLFVVIRRPERTKSGGSRKGSHLRGYRRCTQVPQECQINLCTVYLLLFTGLFIMVFFFLSSSLLQIVLIECRAEIQTRDKYNLHHTFPPYPNFATQVFCLLLQ